mgnify:CR=1 FL=1
MKIIYTTVGTSLITNKLYAHPPDRKLQELYRQLLVDNVLLAELEDSLIHQLEQIYQQATIEDRQGLSAELSSLVRLGVETDDRIILLVTDTPDGKICAKALRNFIKDLFALPDDAVDIKIVRGLQIKDPVVFQEEGIHNLLDFFTRQFSANRYGSVINITGGYKGVVPFLTLIGMLYNVPIVYLYENSNSIITLPALPIQYDIGALEEVFDIMADTDAIKPISEIKQDKQQLLDDYAGIIYEKSAGLVAYTQIGRLLHQKFLRVKSTRVFLSNRALELYNKCAIKNRVANTLNWLKSFDREHAIIGARYSPKHFEMGNGIYVAKKTGDAPRIVWTEKEINGIIKLMILEIFESHSGSYEKFYKHKNDLNLNSYEFDSEFSDF